MSIQIRSGRADVIATGMVTAFLGENIQFSLDDPERLEVEFEFHSDEHSDDVRINLVHTSAGIRLECTNFDHADGRGSAEPVFIAQRNGQVYLLHFRVFRFGQTIDRTIHYTFFAVPDDTVVVQFAE